MMESRCNDCMFPKKVEISKMDSHLGTDGVTEKKNKTLKDWKDIDKTSKRNPAQSNGLGPNTKTKTLTPSKAYSSPEKITLRYCLLDTKGRHHRRPKRAQQPPATTWLPEREKNIFTLSSGYWFGSGMVRVYGRPPY